MPTARARFLTHVLEQLGAPYVYGAAGDVHHGRKCFDCSGLVTWALQKTGGPDMRAFHNTRRMWDEFPSADAPKPGTLVLYGPPGEPHHVMVYVGEGVVVGASGGGRSTLSVGDAEAAGAKVRLCPRLDYRPDRLGLRELPYLLALEAA